MEGCRVQGLESDLGFGARACRFIFEEGGGGGMGFGRDCGPGCSV